MAAWDYQDNDTNVDGVFDNIVNTWYSVGTYPGGGDIKSVTNIPITPNMRATVAAGDVTPATQG